MKKMTVMKNSQSQVKEAIFTLFIAVGSQCELLVVSRCRSFTFFIQGYL